MANIKCTDCANFYCEMGQWGKPMLILGCKLGHWESAKAHKIFDIEECKDYEKQTL